MSHKQHHSMKRGGAFADSHLGGGMGSGFHSSSTSFTSGNLHDSHHHYPHQYQHQHQHQQHSSPPSSSSYSSNPFSYLQEMGSHTLSEVENSSDSHTNDKESPVESEAEIESSSLENDESLEQAELERQSKVLNELGTGPHPLSHQYSFWYIKPPQGSKFSKSNYENLLKCIGTFSTVEDFWAIYLRLKRPYDMNNSSGTTDYSLFLADIRPIWEDAVNSSGGKLLIRWKRGDLVSARHWEILILALLGGELSEFMEEICGIVLSMRPHEDIISIWTKHARDMRVIQLLRDQIKRILSLPANTFLEYRPHHVSKEGGSATSPSDHDDHHSSEIHDTEDLVKKSKEHEIPILVNP